MKLPEDCRWSFPPVSDWDAREDVVAVGADLEPDTLVYAYSRGIFPMYLDEENKALGWWSPTRRGIVPLDGLRITKSMRQSARKYKCTVNHAFDQVIAACSSTHETGNWINQQFIDSYTELHEQGIAHSVEVWDGPYKLVGGLYGVRINGFFAGESMFHRERDASKVALMYLVDIMNAASMTLLDTQWKTEHLASMGGIEIPRAEYLALLEQAVAE